MSYLNCKITTTPSAGAGCPSTAPGMNATDIWIGNKADVTLAAASNGVIGTLPTMAASTNLYKLSIMENDGDIVSNLVEGTYGSSWTQEFNARILSVNDDANQFISEATNGRFVVFVRCKSGVIKVGGTEDGMRLGDGTSMGVSADTFGLALAMRSEENAEVCPNILVTDLATTITGLDALV